MLESTVASPFSYGTVLLKGVYNSLLKRSRNGGTLRDDIFGDCNISYEASFYCSISRHASLQEGFDGIFHLLLVCMVYRIILSPKIFTF